jgi:hypothetical protein
METNPIVLTIDDMPDTEAYFIRIDDVSVEEHEEYNLYVFWVHPLFHGDMKVLVNDLLGGGGGNITKSCHSFEVEANSIGLKFQHPLRAEDNRQRVAEWIRRRNG